jgi:hypothetical protein
VTKRRIKGLLGIVDGILVIVCLVPTARRLAPMFPVIQLGIAAVGILAIFFAGVFLLIFGQNRS